MQTGLEQIENALHIDGLSLNPIQDLVAKPIRGRESRVRSMFSTFQGLSKAIYKCTTKTGPWFMMLDVLACVKSNQSF